MLQDKLNQLKDAVSDREFQKTLIQQVVKMVVVTTAISVTSFVLKTTESSISKAFESQKDLMIDIATPKVE
jgi:hypothetical protein